MAPDILISDIAMPNIDGYGLIRIIREERKRQIPAVALTAMARIDDRVKALTAGYQMHVSKPVEPAAYANDLKQPCRTRESRTRV
jgi:CheY-like chemotaxis protein